MRSASVVATKVTSTRLAIVATTVPDPGWEHLVDVPVATETAVEIIVLASAAAMAW